MAKSYHSEALPTQAAAIARREATGANITLMVAAFNEEAYITDKIKNSLDLDYPNDKIQFLFITDGSDDKTPEIIRQYQQIKL